MKQGLSHFKIGLARKNNWDARIAYKYENKLYHHLETIELLERAKNQRQASQKILKQKQRIIQNVDKKLGNLLEEQIVRDRLKRGEKLLLKEYSDIAVAVKFPDKDASHFMTNLTASEALKNQ